MYIEKLVEECLPQYVENNTGEKLSVLSLCTTNMVYMVFNESNNYPLFVLRAVDSDEMLKAYDVQAILFNALGDLVAKPIAVVEFEQKKFTVVAGLPGSPWFQIGKQYASQAQWDELRQISLKVLSQLQHAIKTHEPWQKKCHLGKELRQAFDAAKNTGCLLSETVHKHVDVLSKQLDEFGIVDSFCQHGDYCLNNLIIDGDHTRVIDFDDFGMTSVPLHDEFSLALSMFSCAPQHIKPELKKEVKRCTVASLPLFGLTEQALPGLLMYHFLLRLGEWSAGGRREDYRHWLLTMVEQYAADSCDWFE